MPKKNLFFYTLWITIFFFCPFNVTSAAPVDISTLTSGARTLKIGHIDFPPFYFISGPHTTGLEPAIFKEVANRAGIKHVEFVLFRTLTDLKNALKGGTIDLIACGFVLTEERAKDYWVSIPYYMRGGIGTLYRPEKSISSPQDLQNLQIGCLTGSYSCQWLSDQAVPASSIKVYDTANELVNALQQKMLDAIVTNFTFCRYHDVKSDHRLKAALLDPRPIVYLLRKEDAALGQVINTALDLMWNDNSLYEIKRKILQPLGIEPAHSY